MTPEERKKVLLKQKEKHNRLHRAVDSVLRTEEGRLLFAHLFNICGYNRPNTVVHPRTGEVLTSSVVYNDSRRNVYIQIRGLASPDLRAAAEALAEAEEQTPTIEDTEEK